MRPYLLIIILIAIANICLSQTENYSLVKPPIDTSVFGKWLSASNPIISNDGLFFSYIIENEPQGKKTLILRSIRDNYETKWIQGSNAAFSEDSRNAFFLKSKDTLCIIQLGTDSIEYVSKVKSFKLLNKSGEEWLLYQLNNEKKQLFLRNLKTGDRKCVDSVLQFWISEDNETLAIKRMSNTTNSSYLFCWNEFSNSSPLLVWHGEGLNNIVFDEINQQIAFSVITKLDAEYETSLWYYKSNTEKPILLATDRNLVTNEHLKLNEIVFFSKDGKRLFVRLKRKSEPKGGNNIQMDVWSYSDIILQSLQLNDLTQAEREDKGYTAVIDLKSGHFVRLQYENEEIRFFNNKYRDDIAVITKTDGGDMSELNWNQFSRPSFFLISTISGERRKLPIFYPYEMSPKGKYLIGTNSIIPNKFDELLSYNLENGKISNITKNIHGPMNEEEVFGFLSLKHKGVRVIRWFLEDSAVIISDKFDLWKIDPNGQRTPINLTNGYGRKHKIIFRLCGSINNHFKPIDTSQFFLLLSAFNSVNKNSGFYALDLTKKKDPQILTMGPFYYENYSHLFGPIKARDANVYIIDRQTCKSSNNYYWTIDFSKFTQLTNVSPENEYNWLSSQVITFKTLDGRLEQGVMYRPENFDSLKRYPVIINYYETLSDDANIYKKPDATYHTINIPWFVSNGYLVITPDIHYSTGKPMDGFLQSILGVAKYLSKLAFVDTKRMGVQGHSWGGYETNYLVTHCNIFAAAMSSSGVSDWVSDYSSILSSGKSRESFYEVHQIRIGATLWEQPDLYIKNSPLFNADKVNTPLLMMNNKNDGVVPFEQGLEMFLALRRMGKKVWMLQYDKGLHTIINKQDAMRHTIMITQFFDHYLKSSPSPVWMLNGMPAKRRGADVGLKLVIEKDQKGNYLTPGPGLLSEEENKKVNQLSRRRPVTIIMR